MKANTKNTKGGSPMKKLVPAAGMLMVSATMLATSTFAWFTMSKEVEITGIQMTATVPETIELSLGLGQNSGTLTSGSAAGGIVSAPLNSDTSTDWTNSVAFYNYYAVPKMTPASSINGATILTTNDANGVGKTVDATGSAIAGTKGTITLVNAKTTAPNSETGRADYIDFPVWIRTTQTSNVSLSVRAKVTDGENTSAVATPNSGDMLYKAARVSILKSADGTATPATSDGVIIPFADDTAQTSAKYYVSGKALGTAGTLGTQGSGTAYGDVDAVTQNTTSGMATPDGDAIITVPGKGQTVATNYTGGSTNSSSNYGESVCVIVRVWLEGEDKDCWNATAGQDFQIALEFAKKTS